MKHSHLRRILTLAFGCVALGTLGACAGIRDHDGGHDHWRGGAFDPNGRADRNDRDGKDRDRDGHDQDWR